MQIVLGTRQTPPASVEPSGVYIRLLDDFAFSSPLSGGRWSGDRIGAIVHRSGLQTDLTPAMARVAVPIMAAHVLGGLLDHKTLIDAVWGACPDGGPEWADTALKLHVLRVRRRLSPLGIGILCAPTRGYIAIDVTPQVYRGQGKLGRHPVDPAGAHLYA